MPLLLSNGHLYSVTVAGCQSNALCTSLGPASFLAVTATTRIDATPPTGTVQINGGAAFTNSRNVTLGLAASDPLIDGIAGSSSGVTQYAADIDNDGTFPCPIFIIGNQPTDRSGCAGPFGPSAPATLTDGDGPKTVGVRFGDGARNVVAPCTTIFCTIFLGSPILGNESATATDSIGLDTAKPVAIVTQDRFAVARGGTVVVDSASSLDPNPGSASGIDPTKTTWNFNDGTPVATGAKVSHTYAQVGTFVGELRVRDRAGNVSDPRSFAVTVNAPAGTTASGGGSVLGIQGTAAFTITRLKVSARYAKSRLTGAIALSGTSTAAGPLRAQVRAIAGNRLLATIPLRALAVGGFSRTVKLPATLLPGSYRIVLVGPGGTLALHAPAPAAPRGRDPHRAHRRLPGELHARRNAREAAARPAHGALVAGRAPAGHGAGRLGDDDPRLPARRRLARLREAHGAAARRVDRGRQRDPAGPLGDRRPSARVR